MTIKNIVLSGGGHTLFQSLGIIQTLEQNNIWKIENIERIYGTSAGAILGAILCLKFDWDTINEYFLNRPWHDVYSINIQSIMEMYSKKGLFNRNFFEISFKPLLHAKDLNLDITLKELYEYSNIELHLFTFDINYFKFEDINYKSYPDLPLLTAIYMSSAIPILFSPVCLNNKCYIDGGLVSNYPLMFCIEQNCNLDEILGIKNDYCEVVKDENDNNIEKSENDIIEDSLNETEQFNKNILRSSNPITSDSSIIDFIISFFHKVILNLNIDNKIYNIKHEVKCKCQYVSYTFFNKVISSFNTRKQLLDDGIECGNEFINDFLNVKTDSGEKNEDNEGMCCANDILGPSSHIRDNL
jgi:predicted acylesterase/phospholipase RssA